MRNIRMSRRRVLGTAAAFGASALVGVQPHIASGDGPARPYKLVAPSIAADGTGTTTATSYPPGSFRPLADKLGFRMGVGGFLNDLQTLDALGWTAKLISDQYNSLLVGNVMGWHYAPTRDASGIHYDFSRPDKVLQYSQATHMDKNQVGQHLSWWRPEQVGSWVADIKDRAEADAVLVDVTTNLVNHFPFPSWTINEYGPRANRSDLMYSKWGPDYLFRVAEIAKSVKPSIRLYYNDFGSEARGENQDRDFGLMQRGQSDGQFDGMYFQCHFNGYLPTYDTLVRSFQRFRNIGNGTFQVGISEFGVTNSSFAGTTEQKQNAYADFAAGALRAVFAVGGDLFSMGSPWDGGDSIPDETVLFDAQGNPKPARDRLLTVLNDEVQKRGLR